MDLHKRLMETKAEGDSMTPLIESGARVILDVSSKRAYRAGDIVAYIGSKGSLVVHRIIHLFTDRAGRRTYILKGDHNKGADRHVGTRRIVGKVQKIIYPSYAVDLSAPLSRYGARLIAYFGTVTSAHPWFYGVERFVTKAFVLVTIVSSRRSK